MALNPYFNQGGGIGSGYTTEQSLIESLYTEAVKIYGFEMYYIPRTLVNVDTVFTEDALSEFTSSRPIEMYLQSVDGYEGEGDFLSKFGVEVRDSAQFVVVRSRWTAAVDDHESLIVEGRPNEGDLLYFPLTNSLFEIKFVEHENVFYQANQIYTYRLDVEKFVYSSENFDTGITDVDALNSRSLDQFAYELELEDGSGALLLENGFKIIKEDYTISEIEPLQGQNTTTFNWDVEDIIDFSESNPFGDIGRY
jgi:hypothetical protein